MGRYLERTEHLCRLLRSQTAALVDRPIEEIHSGWNRIYNSMNRQPPVGGLELIDSDEFTLADSFTLTDDLAFERSNPDSVWSCLSYGRENARQMRHCISGEMWTHLNLAYLRMQEIDILSIWRDSPESFFAETAAEMDTFVGIATATMYRDEGWHFMQLGRFIEGAQLASSAPAGSAAARAQRQGRAGSGLDGPLAGLQRGGDLQPPLRESRFSPITCWILSPRTPTCPVLCAAPGPGRAGIERLGIGSQRKVQRSRPAPLREGSRAHPL